MNFRTTISLVTCRLPLMMHGERSMFCDVVVLIVVIIIMTITIMMRGGGERIYFAKTEGGGSWSLRRIRMSAEKKGGGVRRLAWRD